MTSYTTPASTTPTTPTTPPPPRPDLYKVLHTTAFAFIESLAYSPHSPPPTRLNIPLILSLRTKTYTHTFGHNYFVSTAPPLQGTYNLDDFINHITHITAHLSSWDSKVHTICVDEAKRMVVARATYWMKVYGQTEAVENDLVWWLWMDADGKKVERSVEFIDAGAGKVVKEMIDEVKNNKGTRRNSI